MRLRLLMLLFCAILGLCSCFPAETKYPIGRDTAVRVGDGRFDILRTTDVDDSGKVLGNMYCVIDCETQDQIEPNVNEYFLDYSNSKLYLIGSEGYTVVDYKKTNWKTHKNIAEFNADEQNIFNKKRFKKPS